MKIGDNEFWILDLNVSGPLAGCWHEVMDGDIDGGFSPIKEDGIGCVGN